MASRHSCMEALVVNMAYKKLRAREVSEKGLRETDDVFTFYYDESNNIRKLHITESGFNGGTPGNFVLAGIVHRGHSHEGDFPGLLSELKLQKTSLELKLRHIGSGGFEEILSSRKLGIFVQWLLDRGIYIHYSNLNVILWSLVDIVDSILCETAVELRPWHMILKSDLYKVLMEDERSFFRAARKYKYPNLTPSGCREFQRDIIEIYRNNCNVLSQERRRLLEFLLKEMLSLDELPFLVDEMDCVVISNFAPFYFRNTYIFPNSNHIFDAEHSIEGVMSSFVFPADPGKTPNYRFVESRSVNEIQVSDVVAGLLGKYFTFIRDSSDADIARSKNSLNDQQRNNMAALRDLIDKSDFVSNAFFHSVATEDEFRKHLYFMHDRVAI